MFKTLISILILLAIVVGVAATVNPEVRAKLVTIGQQVSELVVQIINRIKERATAANPAGFALLLGDRSG